MCGCALIEITIIIKRIVQFVLLLWLNYNSSTIIIDYQITSKSGSSIDKQRPIVTVILLNLGVTRRQACGYPGGDSEDAEKYARSSYELKEGIPRRGALLAWVN